MPKRKLKVFLSHAPNDEAAARELSLQLTAEGWIDVWLAEENVAVGENPSQEIEKAVNISEIAIICVSKSSTTQQGSVQRELRLVLEMAQHIPEGIIYIVPLKFEECEPPFLLRHLRFADYFEQEREKGYQRLLISLRKRAEGLGISTAAKPAPARPGAPVEPETIPSAEPAETIGPTGGVEIGGNTNRSAIVTGHGNVINIYNNSVIHSNQPEEKSADE